MTSQLPPVEQRWPGERLGLPEHGPRSIGRPGRRIGAIFVDWGLSVLVSVAFFSYDAVATLAVFAITQFVFVMLVNGSIGHHVFRMRVVPLTAGPDGQPQRLARSPGRRQPIRGRVQR